MVGLLLIALCLVCGIACFWMADPSFKAAGLIPIVLSVSVDLWVWIDLSSFIDIVGKGISAIILSIGLKLGGVTWGIWACNTARAQMLKREGAP